MKRLSIVILSLFIIVLSGCNSNKDIDADVTTEDNVVKGDIVENDRDEELEEIEEEEQNEEDKKEEESNQEEKQEDNKKEEDNKDRQEENSKEEKDSKEEIENKDKDNSGKKNEEIGIKKDKEIKKDLNTDEELKVKDVNNTLESNIKELKHILSLNPDNIVKEYGKPISVRTPEDENYETNDDSYKLGLDGGADYVEYSDKVIFHGFGEVYSVAYPDLRDMLGINGKLTRENLKKVLGTPINDSPAGYDEEMGEDVGSYLVFNVEGLEFIFKDLGENHEVLLVK